MPGQTTATTATHDAADRRAAARALLARPMLTVRTHPDELALVRRHAAALKSTFRTMLGYPLIVESHFARLVKRPLSPQAPVRPACRRSGAEFTPRMYSFLALVCAGLLATDVGEQLLVSNLVEQLRVDAATAGISIDDEHADRRSLVAAVEQLIDWGVLVETDGTVAAWGERHEEALLTVNRALLPHLLSRPLPSIESPGSLWAVDQTEPEQPRRTLRQKLIENPLVRREDLTDAERDVLSRERNELSRLLDEHFGLSLDVRAEGALAYDDDGQLTDVEFPGSGTSKQAALLLLDALIDRSRPKAGSEIVLDGRVVPGVLLPWPVVDEELADLAARNSKVWRADRVNDLPKLRGDVLAVLSGMSLAAATTSGLAIHPAAGRYRPEPHREPARRQGRRADAPQTDLFTSEPSATEMP
jgi:uncharacterized protein (TIGR02678 family)